MFTKSHARSQNWISSLYVILLIIIPQTIHQITRKLLFQAVPEPKPSCSRLKFKAFQVNSQAVPSFVPSLFQVILPFGQDFSKSLRKLHQNFPHNPLCPTNNKIPSEFKLKNLISKLVPWKNFKLLIFIHPAIPSQQPGPPSPKKYNPAGLFRTELFSIEKNIENS